MTALLLLLILIVLLCMFRTVRIMIGLFIVLIWWNWPTHKPDDKIAESPPIVIEQSEPDRSECGEKDEQAAYDFRPAYCSE